MESIYDENGKIRLDKMEGTFFYGLSNDQSDFFLFWMRIYTTTQFLIGLIGCPMNFFVIFIIAKYTKLRKRIYDPLMAAICLFDMISAVTNFMPFLHYLALWPISLIKCFLLDFWDLFSLTMVYQLLFAIALDRLLCLLFPIWYKNRLHSNFSRRISLLCYIFVSMLHAFYLAQINFRYVLQNPYRLVFSAMHDISPKQTDQNMSFYEIYAFYYHAVGINVSTIICYFLIWILIKIGHTNSNSMAILRSLSVITLTSFFCWLIPMYIPKFIILPLKLPYYRSVIIGHFIGITVRISGVLNGPILFICSKSEYRPIMQTELKRFYNNFMVPFQHCHGHRGNSVANIQVLPVSIPQMNLNPSLRANYSGEA